jgi:predicted acetylornithine/succinylornithine family transaminase
MHLWDAEGRRYLDMLSGLAVNSFGHCHPAIVEAVRDQVGRLSHVSNLYAVPVTVEFVEKLLALSGYQRAFLCNSGAEAVEASMKLARLYARSVRGEDRHEYVAFEHAFHGRTMGALSVTGTAKYRESFQPLIPGVTFCDYGDLDAVRAAVGRSTAAVIVEAVQGEGGVVPAPAGFLSGLREICDEAGALLILDEVQAGMGRTGRFFAWQGHMAQEARPDICSLSKSLGGGLPLGAAVTTEEVGQVLTPGTHATTFGGNPVACAAGLAGLNLLEGGLLERSAEMGAALSKALDAFAERTPAVQSVRGQGLLMGLVLDRPAKPVTVDVLGRGVITGRAGENVLRFAPPLIVEEEDIASALSAVEAALA